jgi:hypothetical protein
MGTQKMQSDAQVDRDKKIMYAKVSNAARHDRFASMDGADYLYPDLTLADAAQLMAELELVMLVLSDREVISGVAFIDRRMMLKKESQEQQKPKLYVLNTKGDFVHVNDGKKATTVQTSAIKHTTAPVKIVLVKLNSSRREQTFVYHVLNDSPVQVYPKVDIAMASATVTNPRAPKSAIVQLQLYRSFRGHLPLSIWFVNEDAGIGYDTVDSHLTVFLPTTSLVRDVVPALHETRYLEQYIIPMLRNQKPTTSHGQVLSTVPKWSYSFAIMASYPTLLSHPDMLDMNVWDLTYDPYLCRYALGVLVFKTT